MMRAENGTYALIMKAQMIETVQIGMLGSLNIQPGYYVYVGSAFGPGGIRARIRHHLKEGSTKHWHLDYLKQAVDMSEIWYSYGCTKYEHQWAKIFNRFSGASLPLLGFGASDCSCKSHLFFFKTKPHSEEFKIKLQENTIEQENLHVLTLKGED